MLQLEAALDDFAHQGAEGPFRCKTRTNRGGVLKQFHRLHLLTTFVEGTSKLASRAWVALEVGTASGDSGNNIDLVVFDPLDGNVVVGFGSKNIALQRLSQID